MKYNVKQANVPPIAECLKGGRCRHEIYENIYQSALKTIQINGEQTLFYTQACYGYVI